MLHDASQPQWVLKTVKDIRSQRLVHLSADLAHNVGMTLGNVPGRINGKVCFKTHIQSSSSPLKCNEEEKL